MKTITTHEDDNDDDDDNDNDNDEDDDDDDDDDDNDNNDNVDYDDNDNNDDNDDNFRDDDYRRRMTLDDGGRAEVVLRDGQVHASGHGGLGLADAPPASPSCVLCHRRVLRAAPSGGPFTCEVIDVLGMPSDLDPATRWRTP